MVDEREVRVARRALRREQVASGRVQVSCDRAQDRDGARGLRDVYPAFEPMSRGNRRARCRCVLACERGNLAGVDTADPLRPLGRVGDPQLVFAVHMARELHEARVVGVGVDKRAVPQPLVHYHVDHGEHERKVGPRLWLEELVGMRREGEMQRVDAHQARASLLSIVDLPKRGGARERGLLAPEDHQINALVIAKRGHATIGHALGDRTRHEALGGTHADSGAQRVRKALRHVIREAPAAGLPADELHGSGTMLGLRALDAVGEQRERVFPGDALERAAALLAHAAHRIQDATRVVCDLRGGQPLRAQGTTRALVSGNPARPDDAPLGDVDEHRAGVVAPAAYRADGLNPLHVHRNLPCPPATFA